MVRKSGADSILRWDRCGRIVEERVKSPSLSMPRSLAFAFEFAFFAVAASSVLAWVLLWASSTERQQQARDIDRLQFVWDTADAYVEEQTPQTFDALCIAIYATREAVPE
ncbi:MAG: hypothetical protein DHS20C21_02940 [Gemmatimonadota bacterium]|nr:MAG: hypothetical protein DHS20C21_02940 [Gemmatimonadota bacterium]